MIDDEATSVGACRSTVVHHDLRRDFGCEPWHPKDRPTFLFQPLSPRWQRGAQFMTSTRAVAKFIGDFHAAQL